MKKRIIIVLFTVLFILSLFYSCTEESIMSCQRGLLGQGLPKDEQMANARLEEVFNLISNRDEEALRTLFSKNAVLLSNDLDQTIIDLFDYVHGILVSYCDRGLNGESGFDDGKSYEILFSSYDIVTTEQKYRVAIKECVKNTFDLDEVGIWSLYIIKTEDDTNPKIAYRGDDCYLPGIHIGIKNVMNYVE